jgi:ferredoxin
VAGGKTVAAKLAEAMGVAVKDQEELVAFVACRAGRKTAKMKYAYAGVENCQAANLLFGGDKLCDYGCIGLGSCVRVCPFDAVHITEEGLAVVDAVKCRACQKCVKACPRKLISMVPKGQTVLVACRNLDKGRKAKEVCAIACIACRLCEKNCPVKAITMVDNLAVIDYAKCTRCGICVAKCPQKSILLIGAGEPAEAPVA